MRLISARRSRLEEEKIYQEGINNEETKKIKAKDFDRAFDEGSVSEHLDTKNAKVHYPAKKKGSHLFITKLYKQGRL